LVVWIFSAVEGDKNPTIKVRSTIGTSQPRLHIRIEGAETKITALLQKASGQRALKLQQVRQALKRATAALNNPYFNPVGNAADTEAAIETIAAIIDPPAAVPAMAVPVAAAAALPALPVATAAAVTLVAPVDTQLSQQLDWMCEEEMEDSDPSSGQYSDGSCNSEDRSTAHDEPEEKEDAPTSVLQSAAAWEGAPGMLPSPSYSALESPVLSEEDEMVGFDLAAVDGAPNIGTLEQATELGSVVTAAAAAEFPRRIAPPDSLMLFLAQDEPFDSGLAAVDCATVNGALFGASSLSPFDGPTAGIYGADARINDFDTTMADDE
jgi:hypothetical protein